MSFLGSIGGFLGGVVKTGLNIVTHGALGGGSQVPGLPQPGSSGLITSFAPQFGPQVPMQYPGSVPVPGFYHGTLSRFLPGGESGYTAAPPGYHVNKRYAAYVRAGQMGRSIQDPTAARQVVNPIVRNRRMNPLNPRALKRAVAREHAAVKLMRRAMRGTGYRITRSGFGKTKGRRR